MRPQSLRAHNDKLAAAAHLVIARLRPEDLGATKLNKILWAADCEYYRRHGKSLTGEEEYVRRDNGPCPLNIERVIDTLKRDGAIAESLQPIISYARREFTALKEPDIDQFEPEEVDILLTVALEFTRLTAKQASDDSHDDLWLATATNARMSVAAGSVRLVSPTPEVMEWAKGVFASDEHRKAN